MNTDFSYRFSVAGMGSFAVEEVDGHITGIDFSGNETAPLHRPGAAPSPLLEQAAIELCAYCDGSLSSFSLPLNPQGSEFQQKVWQGLRNIPYGTTTTYGALAQAIGCPGSARAVGGANNKNPIAVVIPCHRVIGADGSMTGYAGGIALKKRLLELEATGLERRR